MADAPLMLEVGRITRAHGLRGDVVVVLTTDREQRLAPGSVLSSDRGDLVVRAARRHQDRWIVAFEGLTSREDAERVRATVLRAEAIDDPADADDLWLHQVVGAAVATVGGDELGRCVAVVANPAADLIELEGGALVPVTFVVDHGDGRITIDPPEGLFDL
jgi:16S rRNA processing protein RimM